MKRVRSISKWVAIAGLIVGGAVPAAEQAKPTVQAMRVVTIEKPLEADSRAQMDVVSTLAVRGMALVAEARNALQAKEQARAVELLTRADTIFNVAEQNLPTSRLREQIDIAKRHLDLDVPASDADLVPIYVELDKLSDEQTQSRWRAAVDRVKSFFHAGDKDNARKQLARLEDAIVVKTVALPLRETSERVTNALQQTKAKEFKKADAILADAESGMRVSVTALVRSVPAAQPPEKKAE